MEAEQRMSQRPQPYDALNALIQEMMDCTEAIEKAKERLKTCQQRQQNIISNALHEAKKRGELHALAQYLYFDGPSEIHRDAVKHSVSLIIHKSPQQWICNGYTCETVCCDCQNKFMYQVQSFTDFQDFHKHQRNTPRRGHVRHDRCPSCLYAFTHGRDQAWEQRKQAEQRNLHHLRTMPYREYLRSEHWQAIRAKALQRARFRCQLCNASAPLHVHHRSYEHRGEEQYHMADVISLCAPCHAKHHDIQE